jgi:hypothetical protein
MLLKSDTNVKYFIREFPKTLFVSINLRIEKKYSPEPAVPYYPSVGARLRAGFRVGERVLLQV